MVTKRSLYYWVWYKNTRLQILLVAIILVTVAARVFPLEMQKRIINQAIGLKDMEALVLYCLLYMGAVFLAGSLKYVINILQGYIGQKTLLAIREQLFQHVLSLPLHFFRRSSPGQVISSLMSELEPMAIFTGSALSAPLVNILTFIAFAGYMFWLNPLLAALSISIYPLEMVVIPFLQKKYNITNRQRTNTLREASGTVGESISGIHEVHGNGSFLLEGRKFGGNISRLYTQGMRLHVLKFGIKFVNNFFQSLGPFILFIVGGIMAIKGRFDLGALVAFLSAYEKVYDPWKELMEFYQLYQDSKVRYAQVMDYFDIEPEFEPHVHERPPLKLAGNIDVQDVSFVVAGNIRLLDHMNVQVRPGEHMALVGFSGSGKSTLAKVIAQLQQYTSGHIALDGHEVGTLSKQDIACNMGVVAQHPFIFNGTLYDNLLYSCDAKLLQSGEWDETKRPSLDRVIEVVQQVGLFVDVLSFGLRSHVDAKHEPELVQSIISAREQFQLIHGEDLDHDIEFIEENTFLRYSSLAENIVFGAPDDPDFTFESLPENKLFLRFLYEYSLFDLLVNIGRDAAERNVELIEMSGENDEIFENSIIRKEEFELYASLVDEMVLREKQRGEAPSIALTEAESNQLLKLALRFTPSEHTLVPMPSTLPSRIPEVRKAFRSYAEAHAPEAFTFYCRASYLGSLSLGDNIIYGHIKSDSAGAQERVQQRLNQLLILENALEKVLEKGLQFDVGSMGDRLSGGQRQKVALARAFLKEPPILILDEATSALDNASQARIQNLLEQKWKGKASVISVIHRLDTLKGYDKVAVLKAGKIIEQGGYEELLNKRGALYELIHKSG
ncbi:ABC transporter ATP-binding protein/permease [Desulfovibrio mangrovi]|uniref:ABC transporter ATP-binding protein/permease n=1 Tax=Desulfovibrio mangrovi TaxID=2976983 RepID=UPI0022458642|nr:ABC transporter ATP-binding protein/permease [Desulfovibrio mangrovi]UZP66631.1 ABC transporter ATP-binding protein/permease [Desulfovibrio mangrovi]